MIVVIIQFKFDLEYVDSILKVNSFRLINIFNIYFNQKK